MTTNEQMDKKEILAMDARRSSDWINKSVIYQIYLRAFTPEGTISAAEKKLAQVAELGVDIVYLCPICLQDDDMRTEFWSDRQNASGLNNPKNPYRIKDFFSIDPEYGDDDDLRSFVKTAHGLGLKVMLDIVFYHCGPTAVFLDEHPDFVKRDKDGNFTDAEWHFPVFNFENQELREYLWSNLEYWVEKFDVDGYRCDVGDWVPVDFWEEGRRRMEKIKPEVVMLNEGERPTHALYAFDASYSFSWSNHTFWRVMVDKSEPATVIADAWKKLSSALPRGAKVIRYTENHDVAHDQRNKRCDNAWGVDGSNAIFATIFTLDGIPFIYNGQEVTDTAPHSIYAQIPVEWDKAGTEEAKQRTELFRKLCKLRHEEDVLYKGSVEWLENGCPEKVLSFVRTLGDEQILSVVNLSSEKVNTWVDVSGGISRKFEKLLAESSELKSQSESEKVELSLGAFGYFIGKR